jgi:hypothetical protein
LFAVAEFWAVLVFAASSLFEAVISLFAAVFVIEVLFSGIYILSMP